MTGQYASVDEDLTAWENLMIFTALNGLDKKQSKAKATQLLQDFTLLEGKTNKSRTFQAACVVV